MIFPHFIWSFIILLLTLFLHFIQSKRFYVNQFADGSEHIPLPPMILFSLFMGKFKYKHSRMLLESMKWNQGVDFYLINIVEKYEDAHDIIQLKQDVNVNNFHVKLQTMDEFSKRVKERLDIDVKFNISWYYKMCDYKPTLAHLFPELMQSKYKYWGFVDTDVIWGNISRFSYWFQNQQPFVISGWWRSTGAASFFIHEDFAIRFFNRTPVYIPALKNLTYHNLDEEGTQVDPSQVIEDGAHSLATLINSYMSQTNQHLNRGRDWKDHCFYDEGDSLDWAGPVRWHRGSLQVIHGSPEFPPGRELMFFHRPCFDFDLPDEIHDNLFEDMVKFGFLLPYWIPISSRYMSSLSLLRNEVTTSRKFLLHYQPFENVTLRYIPLSLN